MDSKLPLSVLLLARDERQALEALLPTLVFAREVVVVCDPAGGGSVREVAERSGARVFERAWDGFGPQRQFALERCTQPWVLWIDADERLSDVSPGAMAALRGRLDASGIQGFRLRRHGTFLGRPIRHCGWRNERVLRLFRREGARFDDAPVHERVEVPAPHGDLPEPWLEHHSYPDWEACVSKLVRYARAGAEKSRREGRTAGALDLLLRPPLRFLRMYVLQLGFLDGAHGLLLCGLAAAQVLLKYGELWTRGRRRGAGP